MLIGGGYRHEARIVAIDETIARALLGWAHGYFDRARPRRRRGVLMARRWTARLAVRAGYLAGPGLSVEAISSLVGRPCDQCRPH